MNYSATKIYFLSDRAAVDVWARFMIENAQEVSQALAQESVRHETWFIGGDDGGLFLICAMDVEDAKASVAISNASALEVDQVHREFKKHWDKKRTVSLEIDRTRTPEFPECELLFEAWSV